MKKYRESDIQIRMDANSRVRRTDIKPSEWSFVKVVASVPHVPHKYFKINAKDRKSKFDLAGYSYTYYPNDPTKQAKLPRLVIYARRLMCLPTQEEAELEGSGYGQAVLATMEVRIRILKWKKQKNVGRLKIKGLKDFGGDPYDFFAKKKGADVRVTKKVYDGSEEMIERLCVDLKMGRPFLAWYEPRTTHKPKEVMMNDGNKVTGEDGSVQPKKAITVCGFKKWKRKGDGKLDGYWIFLHT